MFNSSERGGRRCGGDLDLRELGVDNSLELLPEVFHIRLTRIDVVNFGCEATHDPTLQLPSVQL